MFVKRIFNKECKVVEIKICGLECLFSINLLLYGFIIGGQ